jgi:hypothetical protein
MLKKLVSIVESQSSEDRALENEMKALGGHDVVVNSPELAMRIAAKVQTRRSETAKGGTGTGADAKGKLDTKAQTKVEALTKQELLELPVPLKDLLTRSLPYFESKLEIQVQRISEQVELSAQKILRRLDAGLHEKIDHPDLRALWKDMVRTQVSSLVYGP